MYVYRALRANEFYNKFLLCKEYFNYAPLIGIPQFNEHFGNDALDLVGTHLTKGNTIVTPWISCTKDYNKVKHYLYDTSDFIYGMAIIKNHDMCCIESEKLSKLLYEFQNKYITSEQFINGIRLLYLYDISKCVFDFSTGQSALFNIFIKANLVHFCDRRIRSYMTRREYNYAQSSSEVLVLGEIPEKDTFILDPLLIDLVNFLQSNNLINNIDDELLDSLTKKFVIHHSLLAYDNIESEDMLTEPLKSIYSKLDPILKDVFIYIYILKWNKSNYIQKKNINPEYLNTLVSYLLTIILKESNYLEELGITGINPINSTQSYLNLKQNFQ